MTWKERLQLFRLSTFRQVLAQHGGNVTHAARALKVNKTWFYKVIRTDDKEAKHG